MMSKIRLRLSKKGTAIYISHLDLMHTLQRAFSRAGFKLKYSEGFNPHPQLSSAMPLSVGTSSECEIIDAVLAEDVELQSIPACLNSVLPDGIRILDAYFPERKISDIKWLQVSGIYSYDSGNLSDITGMLSEYFSSGPLIMKKKSKRGISDVDIYPLIQKLKFSLFDGEIIVSAIVSASEPVLNPDNITLALSQNRPDICPDFAAFRRIEFLDSDLIKFR